MVYIHAQDFVDAFIGPFPDSAEAQKHIDTVIVPRGDNATCKIISEEEFREESQGWVICTPQEDKEFIPDA